MQDQEIEGYRLSPQQRRVWPWQQSSAAFRAQCALLFEGDLNLEALQRALESIVDRHQILRTTFQRLPGIAVPLQVIGEEQVPPLHRFDFGDLEPRDRARRIEELFRQEGEQKFDFARGPMLRLALLRVSKDEHVLIVTIPALCADAWTLKNFVREISRNYLAAQRNDESADGGIQYLQFSEWQHELIEARDENADAGRNYWDERRRAHPPSLAFESQPDPDAVFAPATHPVSLESTLPQAAGRLSTSSGAVPAFLLSCWQTLLWRLTAQAEIRVDTVFSGRKYPELEDAFGLLAQSLPVRVRLQPETRFTELLLQTVDEMQRAGEWQEYFGGDDSDVTGPQARAIGFSFIERLPRETAGRLTLSVQAQYVCTDPYKLRLNILGGEGVLAAELEYDPRVYARETITRVGGELEELVKSAIANPEAAVSELDILTESEWQKLVVEFNQTRTEYPKQKCVHELFEAQVERSPDALAVLFRDEQISYGELNGRANQLARYLKRKAVGPQTRVAIAMERSSAMVVGLLGILKAGAAYVPLDPAYPRERLAYMLRDADVPVLLTEMRLLERLPEHQASVICLDADWPDVAREDATNLENEAGPDDLAYVIYTSGSTGRPKGVMIPHRGLVNYLSWCVQAYRVAEGRGSLVHSPIGFDLTVTSLFSPLLVGKSVLLLPEEEGIEALAEALRRESDFSLIKMTPSHLDVLNHLLSADAAPARAKALVIGGEALWGESLSFWRHNAPETRVINEYGPTETVVGSCVYEFSAGASGPGPVPIGRPIANTQVYLLDARLRPVPVGVPGEIYIGGDGLARGYLNAPDLTAERFLGNPFSNEPRGRIYKTGDLARHLPSGDIEYLGRMDEQVKIRGFRIELGEIEAVLVGHEAVQQCAVLAREDSPGDRRLVAYVTAAAGASPTASDLRHYLQQKLPDYMVPSAFVTLADMPLTANGKIDRRALPAPDTSRPVSEGFRPPETPLQETLAEIWKDLLKIERVGLQDNFFELGGHSLLATQLVSRIAQTLNLRVSLRRIFEEPSLEGLALAIAEDLARAELPEEIDQMLAEVSGLSEEEARNRLAAEKQREERGTSSPS